MDLGGYLRLSLPRGRLLLVLCGLALLAACRAPAPEGPPRRAAGLQVQGHRGCRGLRPENSMAAFAHAIALGVDVLELDLGLTRDGVLVVTHDPELDPRRCAGTERLPSRRLRDLNFAQLSVLDCERVADPRFPTQQPARGAGLPRLEQVLDLLLVHPQLVANIEIKTFADRPQLTRPPADFAARLVALVRVRRLQERVVVQSFDPAALIAVRQRAPELTLSALVEGREQIEPMLEASGAAILSPHAGLLRAEDVARYQRRGLKVIPWTVNDPQQMRQLIAWGVDGLITDRPDLLLQLLGRAAASRAERAPGRER